MKNLKSIILCGFIALGLLFTNVTPTFAATGHAGMNVAIGVNNYQTNPNISESVYPYKIQVNQKFNAFVLFADAGHDHLIAYSTDGANGLQNYNGNGWESGDKMVSFPEVSFSTPGRHAIFATMACKQTGTVKTVTFYIDVV